MFATFLLLSANLVAIGFSLRPLPDLVGGDFLDYNEFMEHYKTMDLVTALTNVSDFKVVSRDGIQHTEYSCKKVFATKEETSTVWPPPSLADLQKSNPKYLSDLSLHKDKIKIINFFINEEDDKQNKGKGYVWPIQDISKRSSKACTCGEYRKSHCEKTWAKYETLGGIQGGHGMIIGSQSPWAEAAAFRFGAKKVTTIEYMTITTTHPQLKTLTPAQAAEQFLNRTLDHPDFVISFSSLEHDGLGRYGDPLNAYGDIESIAKVHCMLKPHGLFFLGLPLGVDRIEYNAHRIYGYERLSLILSLGFRLVDAIFERPFRVDDPKNDWQVQPVLVLQKVPVHGHHGNVPPS